jgi:hypothetical protein
MEIKTVDFSEEERNVMVKLGGGTVEEASVVESSPEETNKTEDVAEIVETSSSSGVVENSTEETQEVEAELEPQIIIQEQEPEPIVEQPEATPKKAKVKVYKDAFQAALNKYYNSTENPDVEAFVRAYKSNYDNIDPVEMIRQDILSDPFNKDLPPSVINKLLNKRLSEFDLDSDDDEERADALLLLQREANIVKQRMIESGKKFVSQYESDLEIEFDTLEQDAKAEPTPEEIQAQREALEAQYLPEVSKFVRNGVIQIKDKDGVINIPAIDAKEYVNSMVDPVGFISSFAFNPDGTANIGKWIQAVTAIKNLSGYNSTLIKHGIAIGQDKFTSKLKNEVSLVNPRPTDGKSQSRTPKDDPRGFIEALQNIRPLN